MAFPSKVDYLGLSDSDLILRDCDEGRSAEVAEATDKNGDVAASEVYGEKNSPSASYAVKADVEKDLVLGAVATVTDGGVTKYYALTQVQINTSAGSAPTVSASSSCRMFHSRFAARSFSSFAMTLRHAPTSPMSRSLSRQQLA